MQQTDKKQFSDTVIKFMQQTFILSIHCIVNIMLHAGSC